jgi:hypothetical protein
MLSSMSSSLACNSLRPTRSPRLRSVVKLARNQCAEVL